MTKLHKVGLVAAITISVLGFIVYPFQKGYASVPGTGDLLSYESSNTTNSSYNDAIYIPSPSADGKKVAFVSQSTDLVSGDTNNRADVFVRDTDNNTTQRVSLDPSGSQFTSASADPHISGNGRYVTFRVGTNIYLRNLTTNVTTVVSKKTDGNPLGSTNASSQASGVSDDGRFVAFLSAGANLVSGVTFNGYFRAYVRDTKNNVNKLINANSSGAPTNGGINGMVMSCDGRYIVIVSDATDFVASDTNGESDIFLVDRVDGQTVTDVTSGADGSSSEATISCNGNYVGFRTPATNIVTGDTNSQDDSFVYDVDAGTFDRVNVDNSGTQSTSSAGAAYVSDNGRYATFVSSATDLTTTSTNSKRQVYLRDRKNGTTEMISTEQYTTHHAGLNDSDIPVVSANGKKIVFASTSDLVDITYSGPWGWAYYYADTGADD